MIIKEGNMVFMLTSEIHEGIDDIYEAIMDDEPDKQIEKKIDETVKKLKELKESVTKNKDE